MHKKKQIATFGMLAKVASAAYIFSTVIDIHTGLADETKVVPYIRLDAGGSFSGNANGNIVDGTGFGNDFGSGYTAGGGFGFAFPAKSGWFSWRTDVTAATHQDLGGTHKGQLDAGTPISAEAKLFNTTVLLNVYADFNAIAGITPFIGIGAGPSWNRTKAMTYRSPSGALASLNGRSDTATAVSATIGGSYDLNEHIGLNISYRFTSAGRVKSGGTLAYLDGTGRSALVDPLRSRLNLHDITIGVQYRF